MKKISKSNIFSFILGAIIFGTTSAIAATFLANNISYDNTSSGINANNVQDAIDTLYTRANTSYDEYNGAISFTPSTSTQTAATNNKLMKSNITINPIPSSYKNLSQNTTADASKILSGYTSYNSNGQLITGNISTNCVSGTYIKNANSQMNLNIGFMPSKFEMYFMNSNQNGKMIIIYDSNICESTNSFYQIQHPNNIANVLINNDNYNFINNNLISSYITTGDANSPYKNQITYYYMACK